MENDQVSQEADWDVDAQIEQTERHAEHWEHKARLHDGTPFGELIKSIANGYSLQLAALRGQRPSSS